MKPGDENPRPQGTPAPTSRDRTSAAGRPSSRGGSGHRHPRGQSRIHRLQRRVAALWRRPWVRVLLIALVLLLLDGAYVAVRGALMFRTTVAQFQEGAQSLMTGDLPSARKGFQDARTSSRRAHSLASSPAAVPWRLIPWFDRDALTAEALAESGELAARAGLQLVEAADAVGVSKEQLTSAIYRDGRVRLAALDEGKPFIAAAAATMARAVVALKDSPDPVLLQGRFDSEQARLEAASATLFKIRLTFHALPSLLGERRPRHYFLAFQAPSEQRGGGGLISLWGILTAERGRLNLSKVRSITTLVPLLDHPVSGPGWFAHLYGPMSGLSEWQQANSSPDFPVVARVLLRMYRESKGQRLDGVLSMDPVALGYLTEATGPLRAKGLDVDVGPGNASDVLLNESYSRFHNPARQNEYLSRLINQFWDRLSLGAFDAPTLVGALERSIAGRHFKAFSVKHADEKALRGLDAAAGYSGLGSNLQSVFHNNGVPNKVDFFLHKTIDTSVQLTQRGDADFMTTAILRNAAPDGPASIQLGPSTKGRTPGLNRMILEFLLPQGAHLQSMELNGERVSPLQGKEEDFPVFWQIFDIPAGSTAGVTVRYLVPHAFEPSEQGATFSMSLLPQSAVRPDRYSLRVHPPYGSHVIGASDSSGAAIFSGRLTTARTFRVRFANQ